MFWISLGKFLFFIVILNTFYLVYGQKLMLISCNKIELLHLVAKSVFLWTELWKLTTFFTKLQLVLLLQKKNWKEYQKYEFPSWVCITTFVVLHVIHFSFSINLKVRSVLKIPSHSGHISPEVIRDIEAIAQEFIKCGIWNSTTFASMVAINPWEKNPVINFC